MEKRSSRANASCQICFRKVYMIRSKREPAHSLTSMMKDENNEIQKQRRGEEAMAFRTMLSMQWGCVGIVNLPKSNPINEKAGTSLDCWWRGTVIVFLNYSTVLQLYCHV